MSADTLVRTLSQLEGELHLPGVRKSASRINALLHADFEEVGRSGRHWNRAAMVDMLLSESVPVEVVADNYVATELQAGVALLTYRAAHRQANGTLARHTLRSSIWIWVGDGWQMRYHQGTAAAQTW
ncbi:nuclear transport factor 2 family protein [Roseateles sp. PN1]|uniref:nuclear transport factor 2 family protein n=1 Tax=Roseateles sp. PN1 TaxID=3137372 RepID=UPI00313A42BD